MTDRRHAELMLEHALALVAWDTERSVDDLKALLLLEDRAIHSRFRHALARIVAWELSQLLVVTAEAARTPGIPHALWPLAAKRRTGVRPLARQVYVYGSQLENRARLNSDIDLLVVPGPCPAATRRRLQELDRELTAAYNALLCSALSTDGPRPAPYLLDFHLISRRDIRCRRGYAAILTDPYALRPEVLVDSRVQAGISVSP
jgi:predicted nucleotidyltransferase